MALVRTVLPLWVKVGYGAAELGMSAVEVMLQLYLLVYYTQVVDLEPQYAGIALALAILWDAIADPTMGGISDNTRLRAGKRRPYILMGGFFMAGSMVLLFSPPAMETQLAKFLFLLVSYMLLNTSLTVINVPHSALAGELTFDRNVRTELFGWRLLFKNAGFLLGAMTPGVLLTSLQARGIADAEHISRAQAGRWIAGACIASALITYVITRGYDTPAAGRPQWETESIGTRFRAFLLGLRSVVTNPVFLPLLIAYIIAFMGRTINASLSLLYYEVYLELTEFQTVVYILGPFMGVLTLSIAVWVWLSRRYGKKRPAFWGALLLGISSAIVYPLLPAGQLLPPILFVSLFSGALVGSIILFDSLVADIVDYDELKTGRHREGLYFGCWLMATKIARAAGLVATGWMLQLVGYNEDAATQAPSVAWRIALLYGPVVGLCFVGAAVVFLWMPLTDARHRRIQVLLQRRQDHRAQRKAKVPAQFPPSHPSAESTS